MQSHTVLQGFPSGSAVKNLPANAGDAGLIPRSGRLLDKEMATHSRASLVSQLVKNLPSIWETWVRSLGREDPLERGIATHSSILAWEIPWIEEPSGLQSMGSQKSQIY